MERRLTKGEAERLALGAREWTGWRLVATEPMEARRLGTGEWKHAVGPQIRDESSRAKGLERRRGWCVRFEVLPRGEEETEVVDVFPMVASVYVFDDGRIEVV